MGTFVISGGTDGIGKAIAVNRLRLGHEVVVIGRDAAKGKAFLDTAADVGADGRAHFVLADLSLVGQTRQAIDEIRPLRENRDDRRAGHPGAGRR